MIIKTVKIRIYPNNSQRILINGTISCIRYIKNLYIEYNIKSIENGEGFITENSFSKFINKLKNEEEEYYWIKKYSTKAIKYGIKEEYKAFKKYFNKTSGFPKFKSKKDNVHDSYYFIKDGIHLTDNKRIIKIPIIGKIRITDECSIPMIDSIVSGRIIREYNKYYVMFIYKTNEIDIKHIKYKVGIDVGLKNYATLFYSSYDQFFIPHFKDNDNYKQHKKCCKKLKEIRDRKQQINLSRSIEDFQSQYKRKPNTEEYNTLLSKSFQTSNIIKINKKIYRHERKMKHIREDYIHKLIYLIVVRTKPYKIFIEDLKIKKLVTQTQYQQLRPLIMESGFYTFKEKLIYKCHEYRTGVYLVKETYPSTKICSNCGIKNKNISISDRIFSCSFCGAKIDRDINAAYNICNVKKRYYKQA